MQLQINATRNTDMDSVQPSETSNSAGSSLDLIDVDQVCLILGGSKPVHRATVYRGIAAGKYPKPIKIGPNVSRWTRAEWLQIVKARIAARDDVQH
jgi:predicted DNA-binding transcriptional regulator AlpA